VDRGDVRQPFELRLRRLGVDTHQEPVVYLREDSPVCRSEGFEAQSRVRVDAGGRSIVATLNVVHGDLLAKGEAGLSEAAWRLLAPREGAVARVRHALPPASFSHVLGKIHGKRFRQGPMSEVVSEIAAGRYSDVQLSSFVTCCAQEALDDDEVTSLTRAMIAVGERMTWGRVPVVDKHSVGGLPGNRTTPIVVAIVAACGLTMPKTSSRAITSPAGTADTMETLAPVDLDLAAMRRVVEAEGGCVVWGGSVHLSPADDILIRVERALELDSSGQLIASILSKKAAAGSTHVVVDLPVGPSAKLRSPEAASRLVRSLVSVGGRVGLDVRVSVGDGTQPIGRGIGPALEARDVLAVLKAETSAPPDLRRRAVQLAGEILEMVDAAPAGQGAAAAALVLDDGRAWKKFEAICRAQGGLRTPPVASHRRVVEADRDGVVLRMENRRLSRLAKLAGAPGAAAAGIELHVRDGDRVVRGQPLFTIHAETRGELAYAVEYMDAQDFLLELQAGA
jgi:thymidine phosphorylase